MGVAVFTKDKPILDRLIAALAACEIKTFVIPTPLNLWRRQPMTEADTAALVESYRVKLGLLPWPDHAKTCIHIGGRRSGKTTRTILEAIVVTIEQPSKLAVIATMPSSVEPLRKLVRDIAQRLKVDASRVYVRSYRQLAWDDGHRWYAPNVHRFLDDLDASHDPEQKHWILRAHDQELVPLMSR